MRLILVTQSDPFFLGRKLTTLVESLHPHHQVVACVLLGASPFGKRTTNFQRVLEALRIFGLSFLLHYTWKWIRSKLRGEPSVEHVMALAGIPVLKATRSINRPDFLEKLRAYVPDMLISITANQIFKRPLLDLAPKGCLNLHTALLPKYRGLMPSFWVLRNGETHTGVSVFEMDEGIDSGPIVIQKAIPIDGRSQESLIDDTKTLGMQAILEAVEIMDQNIPTRIPNHNQESTYYHFPTREDVRAFRRQGARFF